MKATITIPAWRIFTNWGIAVLTGSITWPILTALYEGDGLPYNGLAGIFVISMAASAISSFPAIIVLFAVHVMLNKRKVSLSEHRRIHSIIHLLAGVLTFAVLLLMHMNGRSFRMSMLKPELVCMALTYIAAGMITALVTYRIYEKRQLSIPVEKPAEKIGTTEV